ncbi:MAG: YCF48-related protein [Acidobacteriota bacterium]|nr:YCF48-related protein [Acidobacteriota bacterium]
MFWKPVFKYLSLMLLSVVAFFPLTNSGAQIQSQRGWTQQSSGVLSKLNAIVFANRQRGWAAGGNGMLLSTEDGGQHWQPMLLPPKMRKEPLLDLWANDKQLLLLGEFGLFNRRPDIQWHERVFLLRSEDRGALWMDAQLARPPLQPNQSLTIKKTTKDTLEIEEPKPPPDPVLLRMAFADERIGWAVGELGTIQATADGGATWKLQVIQSRKILNDISAIDAQRAWIVGAAGLALHTEDGGQSWKEQPTGIATNLRAVHFVDANRGWAVGSGGVILSTVNGGARWQPQNSGTQQTLNDVYFVGSKEGWAVGERGTLLHTTDGGTTWLEESPGTRANLQRVFFVAPDCGWAVGTNGAIFSYGAKDSERPTIKPNQ